MAVVLVTKELREEIFSKFKEQSKEIIKHLIALEDEPHRGKAVGQVKGIVIKEVKYEKFRFYCVTDGHILKFGSVDELAALLIKFVRMSEKKDQQKIINEIKNILMSMGMEGF